MDIKYVEIKEDNYYLKIQDFRVGKSETNARLVKLYSGDIFTVFDDEHSVKCGDRVSEYGIVIEVNYNKKKWWQFWRKKKQVSYTVLWASSTKRPIEANPSIVDCQLK